MVFSPRSFQCFAIPGVLLQGQPYLGLLRFPDCHCQFFLFEHILTRFCICYCFLLSGVNVVFVVRGNHHEFLQMKGDIKCYLIDRPLQSLTLINGHFHLKNGHFYIINCHFDSRGFFPHTKHVIFAFSPGIIFYQELILCL